MSSEDCTAEIDLGTVLQEFREERDAPSIDMTTESTSQATTYEQHDVYIQRPDIIPVSGYHYFS